MGAAPTVFSVSIHAPPDGNPASGTPLFALGSGRRSPSLFSFKQGRLEEAERGQRLSQGKSWPVSLLWIPEQGWAKVKLRGWGQSVAVGLELLMWFETPQGGGCSLA